MQQKETQGVEVAGEMMNVMREQAKLQREEEAVKTARQHQRRAMIEPS